LRDLSGRPAPLGTSSSQTGASIAVWSRAVIVPCQPGLHLLLVLPLSALGMDSPNPGTVDNPPLPAARKQPSLPQPVDHGQADLLWAMNDPSPPSLLAVAGTLVARSPHSLCLLALVVGAAPGVPPCLTLGQGQVGQEGRQGALYLVGPPAQGVLRGAVVGTFPIEADVVG
jgi:hypothetical protein